MEVEPADAERTVTVRDAAAPSDTAPSGTAPGGTAPGGTAPGDVATPGDAVTVRDAAASGGTAPGDVATPRDAVTPRDVVTPRRTVVVGAAILDGQGRVLAAQRSEPPGLAGLWEFPGGKVEPGEADLAALHRECDEELGVRIEPGGRLGTDIALGVRKNSPEGTAVLRVWTARLLAGEVPQAREHLELRWLAAHQLGDVEWLPADLPLVEALREVLIHKV